MAIFNSYVKLPEGISISFPPVPKPLSYGLTPGPQTAQPQRFRKPLPANLGAVNVAACLFIAYL